MHPVIRVVCFLVFLGVLTRAGLGEFASAALLILLTYLVRAAADFRRGLRMLFRLRWLLLSIAFVYLAFTPGVSLWQSAWAPSQAGLNGAARALANLALVVLAVNLLLLATTRAELLAALRFLLRPGRYLGLPVNRLALRLTLVFDLLPQVESLLRARRNADQETQRGLRRHGDLLAACFADVLRRAENFPLSPIHLDTQTAPRPWQWLYPVLLAVAIVAPARLLAVV